MSDSLSQVENTPPGTLRMPTRSSPSAVPAQIEYERRCSLPAIVSFSVRCWPWVKRNCSASSAGTSNETTTASSVSGRTLLTLMGIANRAAGEVAAQTGGD